MVGSGKLRSGTVRSYSFRLGMARFGASTVRFGGVIFMAWLAMVNLSGRVWKHLNNQNPL